jgi:hypothetical protein
MTVRQRLLIVAGSFALLNVGLSNEIAAQAFPCEHTCTPTLGQEAVWICHEGETSFWVQGCQPAAHGLNCGDTEAGPRPQGGCG